MPMRNSRILFRCYSSSEGETLDCDYAILPVSPELYTTLLKRERIASAVQKEDESACCVEFFDYSLDYLTYTPEFDEALADALGDDKYEEFEAGDIAWLPGDFVLPDDRPRTECNVMEVTPLFAGGNTYFRWRATPKHSGIYVTTPDFTLSMLTAN